MKTDESGIPAELGKYFKKHDMIEPHIEFHGLSLIVWCTISYIITTVFLSMQKGARPDSFFVILCSLISFPFIAFAYKLYNLHRVRRLNLKPMVPADFGVCFTPWAGLSNEEKDAGIVGSTSLRCQKSQDDYIFYSGTEIQSKTYIIVYTIFTLTLLFYPLPAGVPFDRNDVFKKVLMKLTVLVSLILLSAPILMTNRWSSLFLETLYSNLLLMNVDILMVLIAYIVYKIGVLPPGKSK